MTAPIELIPAWSSAPHPGRAQLAAELLIDRRGALTRDDEDSMAIAVLEANGAVRVVRSRIVK